MAQKTVKRREWTKEDVRALKTLTKEGMKPSVIARKLKRSEGEVLDILVQPRRARQAAFKLMRKLLKKQGITPATLVTDKLRSYGSALRELGVAWRHDTGRRKNNRAENSHQPCDNANDV